MFGIKSRPSLRHKIGAIGAVGVVGLVVVAAFFLVGIASQDHYRTIAEDAREVSGLAGEAAILLLEARRAEKDFIIRADEKYATRHDELERQVDGKLTAIRRKLQSIDDHESARNVEAVQAGFAAYSNSFRQLAGARRKLGLDENSGLEGALRNSVHAIEDALKTLDDGRMNAAMLTMRRHEKDFMLRRDLKYVDGIQRRRRRVCAGSRSARPT